MDNDNGDWSDFVGPFEDLQKANGSPTAGCHGWQCLPALQWSNHLINSAPGQRLLQSANHAARVLQPMLSSAHYLQSKGKLARDRCPDVVSTVDTLVRAGADRLARDLTADLEPVRDIIATLRNISSTGMPEASWSKHVDAGAPLQGVRVQHRGFGKGDGATHLDEMQAAR